MNAFWNDYAAWIAKGGPNQGPFVSSHFGEATGNLNEMLLVLSVLDISFIQPKHKVYILLFLLFILMRIKYRLI